jgi:hypothetical protein
MTGSKSRIADLRIKGSECRQSTGSAENTLVLAPQLAF